MGGRTRAGERAGIYAPLPAPFASLLHCQPIPHHPSSKPEFQLVRGGGGIHGVRREWAFIGWVHAHCSSISKPPSLLCTVRKYIPAQRHDMKYTLMKYICTVAEQGGIGQGHRSRLQCSDSPTGGGLADGFSVRRGFWELPRSLASCRATAIPLTIYLLDLLACLPLRPFVGHPWLKKKSLGISCWGTYASRLMHLAHAPSLDMSD